MRAHNVPTNGIRLHVAELGEGPAVLFCHGFPAIGASWKAQAAATAAAGFRALVPDMRGYGASDAPEAAEVYTPFHTVGDLVGLLDHFGIADCVVVGHDFGASIAWNAAMMRPDRFRAVFGISVPFRRPGGPSFLDRLRQAGRGDFYMFAQMRPEADAAWANAAETIPGFLHRSSGQASAEAAWDLFDAPGMLRPAPPAATKAAAATIDAEYPAQAVRAFARTGFHGPLNYYRALDAFFALASGPYAGAAISRPAWFLTGARDALRALEPTEAELREGLTDLRGITALDGVGHWPQLEAPEAVNAALLGFLTQVEAG